MRGKPKGLPKTGGRVKGTPNRQTLSIEQKCIERNCDPISVFIDMVLSTDKSDRYMGAKELSQYLYPKRKSIELSLKDISTEELAAEVEARLGSKDQKDV